jgi:hypothetical protein
VYVGVLGLLTAACFDGDIAAVQRRLADYYDNIKTIHLVYEERGRKQTKPPQNEQVRKTWSETPGFPEDVTHTYELWWRYPSQRLDIRRVDPKKNPSVVDTVYVLHGNRFVRYDKTYRSADEGAIKGLGPFERTPIQLLGRRVTSSLNTSVADLMAIPGVARLATAAELKGRDAAFGAVVGPNIPPDRCPLNLKGAQMTMLFRNPDDVLPASTEIIFPYIHDNGEYAARPSTNPDTHWLKVFEFSDFREVATHDGRRTMFPFKMTTAGQVAVMDWTVTRCEINVPIADELFTDYKREARNIVVDGKIPRERKEAPGTKNPRLEEQHRRIREAEELLQIDAANAGPPQQQSSKWPLLFGLGLIGLGAGVYGMRMKGGSR